jgi:hypothetical protein
MVWAEKLVLRSERCEAGLSKPLHACDRDYSGGERLSDPTLASHAVIPTTSTGTIESSSFEWNNYALLWQCRYLRT